MARNINFMRVIYNKKTMTHLRYITTKEWKTKHLKKAGYKCEITGKKHSYNKTPLTVHHLDKTFDDIVRQAHKELHIKFHTYIYDYIESDLNKVIQLIIDIHKTVKGIVLDADIHSKIHQRFGNKPTEEQVMQYKKNYKSSLYKKRNSCYKHNRAS